MRVLLTRPASGSAALAQVLAHRGHHCSVAHVFTVKDCAWSPAFEGVQAVMLSSRNAARGLEHAWSLPRDL